MRVATRGRTFSRPGVQGREEKVSGRAGRRRELHLAIAFVSGMLIFPFIAWSAGPEEPVKGLRETTREYIALGAPDDLLRLLEAFEKTEEEIARLKLGTLHPERQSQLNAMRDSLAESEELLQLLDSSAKEVPNRQLDRLSAQDRSSFRTRVSGRIEALRESISILVRELRTEQATYLRSLEEERKSLARLLAVRREQLLGEYSRLSSCSAADRSCSARKLKTLCKLQPLFSVAERAPILMLQQETADRLEVGLGSLSPLCDYLRFDFAF